jgi:hypothetical protein
LPTLPRRNRQFDWTKRGCTLMHAAQFLRRSSAAHHGAPLRIIFIDLMVRIIR